MRKEKLESYVRHYYEKDTKNYNALVLKLKMKDGTILTYSKTCFSDGVLMYNRGRRGLEDDYKWEDSNYKGLSTEQKVSDFMRYVYLELGKLYETIQNEKTTILYHEYTIVSTDNIAETLFMYEQVEPVWEINKK